MITCDMIAGVVDRCRADVQWQQIALLWINGVAIPWERVWEGERVRSVPLPTYQFAKDKYWFDASVLSGAEGELVAVNRIEPVATSVPPMPKQGAASPRVDSIRPLSTAAKLELL
ncbi:MAG: hypothetical protein HC794_07985, partial [Nitrospiraceae bacterium]|nr:hypothetical protein [Nitrospiraceae bacterium]